MAHANASLCQTEEFQCTIVKVVLNSHKTIGHMAVWDIGMSPAGPTKAEFADS